MSVRHTYREPGGQRPILIRTGQPLPGQFPKARPQLNLKPPPKRKPPPPPVDRDADSASLSAYAAMDDDTLRGLIEIRGDDWTGAIAALEEAG